MRRGQILLVGGLVIVAAAAAAALALGGGPSEEEFRAQALAACERIGVRDAQRVRVDVPKEALQAHRDRIAAALADLRKVEPTDEARPAWNKAVRLHADELRQLDAALKEANGREAHDRGLAGDAELDREILIDEVAGQYRKAGVAKCSLRRSDVYKAADVYRVKADRACVRFLHSPIRSVPTTDTRRGALKVLARLDRDLRTAEPNARPPQEVAAHYRRHLLDRIGKVRRRVEQARARIRNGAPPGPAARRVLRAYGDFYDDYFDTAYTLRFDECLDEQHRLIERERRFTRAVRDACRPTARAIAEAVDRKTLEGAREGHGKLQAMLKRLGRLRPPQRSRPQWRTAMDAARDMDRELGELLSRAGTLTATQVEGYDRRLTAISRRARPAFFALGFPACARVF